MKFDKTYFQPLQEEPPPGKDAEEFIKANKGDFKKRYGSRWEEVLYATAWKKYGTKNENVEMNEAPLNLGQINYPTTKQVIAIQRKLRADAPEILKQYRKLLPQIQKSAVSKKEIVYIRDEPDEDYRKRTGIGDAHRILIRARSNNPLGKEIVVNKGTTETTYETVLAIKEEYIPEAIYKKKIGVQGIRDIKKGTPPYTVVAMKGKKVVDQSKPAMVSSQVPAIIYDFLEKHGKNDSLTIGVEDKSGELVYTYYKPFGEDYIPELQRPVPPPRRDGGRIGDPKKKKKPSSFEKLKKIKGDVKTGKPVTGIPTVYDHVVYEGTWAFPDKPATIKKLKKLLKNPFPVGVSNYNDPVASKDGAESKLKGIIGDDELFDRFDALRKRKGPKADARPVILKWLKKNDVKLESAIEEGGLGGAHKMAKGRIGVSPSHAKKYRDSLGKGSKFEPSKDRDARGGRWDGDDYTMSKKDYAKLHKDFKSKIKGKPYATTMDPKTGATILTPVIITEKRGAEDPYTVKYWYDKQGRKMWATLSGEADAKKFLKNVKGLGMGGVIIKGDVREEVATEAAYPGPDVPIKRTTGTKQAKFAVGNRPGQASDPYTVKYSYTKKGRIMVAVLASKKDAEMFLRNVRGLGMNGIIVKGAQYAKEETIMNHGWKHYLQEGGVRLPRTIEEVRMATLYVMFQSAVLKKEKTLPLGSPIAVQVLDGLNDVNRELKKGGKMALTGKAAVVAFLDIAQQYFSADFPVISTLARKYKLKIDRISNEVDTSNINVNEELDFGFSFDERAGAKRHGGVLMVRTMKQEDGSYKWILQRVEHEGGKGKQTVVDSGTEDSRSKADRAGQKAKKKLKVSEEYIANLKESVDPHTVKELVIYITNDGQLYRQRTLPIIKNLSKKVGNATYDGLKAIKLFMYLAKDGIKKYEKEHATPGWARQISVQTKQAIAEELLDYYTEEIGEEVSPDSNGEAISELFGKKKTLSASQQKKIDAKEKQIDNLKDQIANTQERQNEIQTMFTPRSSGGKGVSPYSMHGKRLKQENKELRTKYKEQKQKYKQAKKDLRVIKKGETPQKKGT